MFNSNLIFSRKKQIHNCQQKDDQLKIQTDEKVVELLNEKEYIKKETVKLDKLNKQHLETINFQNDKIYELENEYQYAKKITVNLKEQNKELQQKNEQLENQQSDYQDQIKSLQEQLKAQQEQISTLQSSIQKQASQTEKVVASPKIKIQTKILKVNEQESRLELEQLFYECLDLLKKEVSKRRHLQPVRLFNKETKASLQEFSKTEKMQLDELENQWRISYLMTRWWIISTDMYLIKKIEKTRSNGNFIFIFLFIFLFRWYIPSNLFYKSPKAYTKQHYKSFYRTNY